MKLSNHVEIVAEAGVNHNGELATALARGRDDAGHRKHRLDQALAIEHHPGRLV